MGRHLSGPPRGKSAAKGVPYQCTALARPFRSLDTGGGAPCLHAADGGDGGGPPPPRESADRGNGPPSRLDDGRGNVGKYMGEGDGPTPPLLLTGGDTGGKQKRLPPYSPSWGRVIEPLRRRSGPARETLLKGGPRPYNGNIDGLAAQDILKQSINELKVDPLQEGRHGVSSGYDWCIQFQLKMTLAHLWPLFEGSDHLPSKWHSDAMWRSTSN